MDGRISRRMWRLFEPVHAVTYFTAEARAAFDAVGMRGFWMSYFAGRAAPLGRVGPAPVTAAFFGFAPRRAGHALPAAWSIAAPAQLLAARSTGAAAALSRLLGPAGLDEAAGLTETAGLDEAAGLTEPAGLTEAADLMWQASQAADTTGRVLAAANQALPRPDLPLLALWQAATTLREHRGDGHVVSLVARRITPVQSHVLKAAADEIDPEWQRRARGLSEHDWDRAAGELRSRGWLAGSALTAVGARARDDLEWATDELALQPWSSIGAVATGRLATLLAPLVGQVLAGGVISVPNPIGLTRARSMAAEALHTTGS
jgi:hypothetical protein